MKLSKSSRDKLSHSVLLCAVINSALLHPVAAAETVKDIPTVDNETAASPNSIQSSVDAELISFEKRVFGQQSPPGKSVEERLLKLEERLFGKETESAPVGLFKRLDKVRSALAKNVTVGNRGGESLPSILTSPSTSTTDLDPSTIVSASTPANSNTSTTSSGANSSPPARGTDGATTFDTEGTANQSAPTELPKPTPAPSGPLVDAKVAFDKGDYKTARHLVEGYIQKTPLDSHGYYLLATIDLKEKNLSLEPQYDQFAYDQFLKGYYLNDKDSDCSFACAFVAKVEIKLNKLDPRLVTLPLYLRSNPNVLLNTGVNLFRRGHDQDARELFDFVIKYAPGCAAGALYNEGAMAEKQGNIKAALSLYKAAGKAIKDRNSLVTAGMLKLSDTDGLTEAYLQYAISHATSKLSQKKPTWDGEGPDAESWLSTRSLVMTLTPRDRRDPLNLLPIMQTEVRTRRNQSWAPSYSSRPARRNKDTRETFGGNGPGRGNSGGG